MNDIVKEVESLAAAGMDMRTRLILWLGGAIMLLVIGLGLAHHFEDRGRTLERAGWVAKEAAERTADLALERKHQDDMQALRNHFETIGRKTSEDHDQEIAQVRAAAAADRADADRRGGLRIPAPACPADRAVAAAAAASTGGLDEPAGASTVRLPQQVENDLWAIADDADEVSAQLRACQGWIRANGFYGPPMSDKGQLLDRMIASPNQNTKEPEDG